MVGRWDRQLTHDFVKKYVELDVLWNVNNPLRKSPKARMKAYLILQQLVKPLEPDFSIPDVRNKIKGFRSVYCMELKKIQQSKNQAYVPSLPWFKMMDDVLHVPAMDNIVKKWHMLQKSVSSIQAKNKLKPLIKKAKIDERKNPLEPDFEHTIIKIENEEIMEATPINLDELNPIDDNDEMTNDQSTAKSNKINSQSSSIHYHRHVQQQTPSTSSTKSSSTLKSTFEFDDEFDIFGKSVAIQLRKLPLNQALKAQLDIQTLLINTRLKLNNQQQKRTTCSLTTQQQPSSTVSKSSTNMEVEHENCDNYDHLE